MSTFRKHLQTAIYGYQPPKFLEAMDARAGGKPVKMPHLWQVMVAPVLILVFAALFVTGSYEVMLGLGVLLALGGSLLALVRGVPDGRTDDDIWLP